jgi:hypothetical protein
MKTGRAGGFTRAVLRGRIRCASLLAAPALAVSMVGTPAPAQVLGPTLSNGEAELGYTYRWYDRDLEPRVTPETEWEVASFYFRYGAYDRVTLMLEAGLWSIDHPDFPTHDYSRYVVGGGLAVRCWEYRRVTFSAVGQYSEVTDYDESSSHFHHRTRNVTAGVQAEYAFSLRRQRLGVWGALLYVYDDARTFLWGTNSTLHSESQDNFGAGAGADLRLFEFLGGFAHLLYADHVQARVGIMLRVSEL